MLLLPARGPAAAYAVRYPRVQGAEKALRNAVAEKRAHELVPAHARAKAVTVAKAEHRIANLH